MSETVFPGLDDLSVEKLMAGYPKRRLAETIAVNQRQMDQLSGELATAQAEARLLADQRDKLLKAWEETEHPCSEVTFCNVCAVLDRLYGIMITDPRDEGKP